MNKQPKHCMTCKHWVPYQVAMGMDRASEEEKAGGFCRSDKITEDHGQGFGADMLVYPYIEGGSFWTGPQFGCVNHARLDDESATC